MPIPHLETHFDVVLTKYLDWLVHNKGKSEATAVKYGRHIRNLQKWAAEQGFSYENLDLELIEQFTGPIAHQRNLSNASRIPMVAAIKGFYIYLRRVGELRVNPVIDLPYPAKSTKLPIAVSPKNAEGMLLSCDLGTFLGARNAAIMSVLFGTGARLSGLINLNESDLTWGIDHKGHERLIIRLREKGAKERLVPAPHETRLFLLAYMGQPELARINRVLPDGDKVLFVSTRNRKVPVHEYYGENRRLKQSGIANIFNAAGISAGVPQGQRNPHSARHMYGKELTEESVDSLMLKTLMGHASVNTTDIYAHIAERKKIESIDKGNPFNRMNTQVTEIAKRLNSTLHKNKLI